MQHLFTCSKENFLNAGTSVSPTMPNDPNDWNYVDRTWKSIQVVVRKFGWWIHVDEIWLKNSVVFDVVGGAKALPQLIIIRTLLISIFFVYLICISIAFDKLVLPWSRAHNAHISFQRQETAERNSLDFVANANIVVLLACARLHSLLQIHLIHHWLTISVYAVAIDFLQLFSSTRYTLYNLQCLTESASIQQRPSSAFY